jgi:hypothetical protein
VLLTRSPLSPGPKAWFSLDLHVLSAPPAFVLSQDQTLREGFVAGPHAIKDGIDRRTPLRACCSKAVSTDSEESALTTRLITLTHPLVAFGAKHGQSSEIEVSTSKNVRC